MPLPGFEIHLLGGLCIRCADGKIVDLPLDQAGAILAYLALNRTRAHTREELVDLFWPEEELESGRHKLRQRLHVLRQRLAAISSEVGSALLTSRSNVDLDSRVVSTDVAAFEQALAAVGTETSPFGRARLLERGIELYKGDLLPGFYQECFDADRIRLSRAFHDALHDLSIAFEERGELDRAIETGRRLLGLDALNEDAHCLLMRLYAAKGQPSAVLKQFQALVRTLEDEFGEKPSAKTVELMERLKEAGQTRALDRLPAWSPESPRSPERAAEEAAPRAAAPYRFRPVLWIGGAVGLVGVVVGLALLTRLHPPSRTRRAASAHAGPAWVYEYSPLADERDSDVSAIASDGKGRTYVAGFVRTLHHDVDFLTIKLDVNGKLMWRRRYNGTGGDVDRLRAIAVDRRENVYVTGDSDNNSGMGPRKFKGLDIVTIKYSPDGREVWEDRYDDIDHSEDRPVAMAIDDYGDVYVLGACSRVRNGNDAGSDFVLIKYNPSGTRLWIKRFDGPDHLDDMPAALSIGRDSVVVAGSSQVARPSGPEYDYLTIKYSLLDGRLLWKQRYGAANRSDDYVQYVGCDFQNGTVTAIGEAKCPPGTPSAGRREYVAIKYSSDGKEIWERASDSDADRIRTVSSAFVCGQGEFYCAGPARDTRGDPVYRAIRRDSSGLPITVYDCPGSSTWDANSPSNVVAGSHSSWLVGSGLDRKGVDFLVAELLPAGGVTVKRGLNRMRGPSYVRAAMSGDVGWIGSVVVGGQVAEESVRNIAVARYEH